MRTRWLVVVGAMALLVLGGQAHADYEKGQAAYKRGDYEGALALWTPLAQRGDRDAQFRLGELYEQGRGVARDPVEAHKWYVLAWKRSVPNARSRALAVRARLTKEQFAESRRRIRAWLEAFAVKAKSSKSAAASAHGSVATFHTLADAATRSPPKESRLRTLCSARAGEVLVTFVTVDGRRVLLAAFTTRPLQDPSKDIWLEMKFLVPRRGPKAPPRPASQPLRTSGTMDWAYVYDRNRDGEVDYFAYLDGPHAVIPSPRTAEVNRLITPSSIRETAEGTQINMVGEQMLFWVRHMRLTFWHAADDNYDGVIDGYAIPTVERRTGWVDGHVVARSPGFDDRFSECRFIPGSVGTKQATCRHTASGPQLRLRKTVPSNNPLPHAGRLFKWVNEAARKCGLTSRHFRAR